MSGLALCPKCDALSDEGDWGESNDYGSCPECGQWSPLDEVECIEVWHCYHCEHINADDDCDAEFCRICGLSKEASDSLNES